MCPPIIDPAAGDIYPDIRGYSIDGVLGEGAVGTVYRARRLDTGVRVALKVLNVTGPKRRKHITRLVKEGRVMSRLNHPGIVKGLDVGESDGHYFIAMEYVDGSSVRDLLDSGRIFTEAETLDFATRVIKALHHAATQGVVHRDVKPANLMITRDAKVKVADLGLAKDAIDLSLTRSDATVGTPQYIAPEQARDSQSVDLRSDIFSLGATLYHMVTGAPPFSGGSLAEIITKVLHENEKPASQLNPALSKAFSKLLARMLAKSPDDRYQSYVGLLADVERVRAGRDIEGLARRGHPAGLAPWQWAAVAVVFLAVIAVFFVMKPWRDEPKPVDVDPGPAKVVVTPVTPEAPPGPAPWIARLGRLENRIDAAVSAGRFADAMNDLDGAKAHYVDRTARDALADLRKRTQQEIRVRIKRTFSERLERLRAETHDALTDEPAAEAFLEIRDRVAAFKRALNEQPSFLDPAFFASFDEGLADVRTQARTKSEELTASGLRHAREDADAFRFKSAEERLARLRRWSLDIYYSEGRIEKERMRNLIATRRTQAREEFEAEYGRFWGDFETAMASLAYAEANQLLEDFRERVRSWQLEAVREAETVANLVERDRSDFLGVVGIWERAIDRLRQLRRTGAITRLSSGSESSKKRVLRVDAEGKYPDKVRIFFDVGTGKTDFLASELRPDHVVELARSHIAEQAVPNRAIAVYFYFESKRPGLAADLASAYLGRAVKAFGDLDRDAGRFQPRIEQWRRVLEQDRDERAEHAARLRAEAQTLYETWDFKRAADKWREVKKLYPILYKERAGDYDAARVRAERASPLGVLLKRFPGAKREHLDERHPLAFKLRWTFDAQTDTRGLVYGWECWRLTIDGLERITPAASGKGTKHEGEKFASSWGLRIPIALNYSRDARVRIELTTDDHRLMDLFGVSLGGNVLGILNLDGFESKGGIPSRYYNQHNLWVTKSRRDAFHGYAGKFLLSAVSDAPSGLRTSFRFGVGRKHVVELRVSDRQRKLTFWADGDERHTLTKPRLRGDDEIEVRCWNAPLTIKSIEIQGVLGR